MYRLIDDWDRIRNAVHIWRDKLTVDPSGRLILPELGLWGQCRDPSQGNGSAGRYVNLLRLQAGHHPNAVEINIPASGIDENVLGGVAEDTDTGRTWILRQGFADFARHTTLCQVDVQPSPRNADRHYYSVACIQDAPEEVQAATAAFVTECDLVRRRLHGRLTPAEEDASVLAEVVRLSEGPPEERISSSRRATLAREIPQRQARVWRALRSLLTSRMSKPVIERLEMDVLIARPGECPLIVEIKTDSGAAAIEQGFGQLLLYGELFRRHPRGSTAELVLLLPSLPRSPIVREVLADCSIIVATYDDRDHPIFSDEFLALCRC